MSCKGKVNRFYIVERMGYISVIFVNRINNVFIRKRIYVYNKMDDVKCVKWKYKEIEVKL